MAQIQSIVLLPPRTYRCPEQARRAKGQYSQRKIGKRILCISSYEVHNIRTQPLKQALQKQVVSLQLILQKAKIDGREIDTVNLYFDKPVVTYGKR